MARAELEAELAKVRAELAAAQQGEEVQLAQLEGQLAVANKMGEEGEEEGGAAGRAGAEIRVPTTTAKDVRKLGLTCKVTWEDIRSKQYCEYRVHPSLEWRPALFSGSVVEELQKTQFVSFLQKWRDIVEMKEDCGSTAKAMAEGLSNCRETANSYCRCMRVLPNVVKYTKNASRVTRIHTPRQVGCRSGFRIPRGCRCRLARRTQTPVRARPGRLSALSIFHCKSVFYGVFVLSMGVQGA
jgi:hypothetical protein